MDLRTLPPAMVSQLANMVEDYVTSGRKKYGPQAVALTDAQRNAMQPFFSSAVLDSARLCVMCGTRVSNPPMYAMAKMMGIRNLPDFADMEAITFVDVIVSHQEFTDALFFHELVHVVQFSQMDMKELLRVLLMDLLRAAAMKRFRWRKGACAGRSLQPERGRGVFCRR
jgi:hypothetical protein